MKQCFFLVAILLAGCKPLPDSAYKTPGQPEALLDRSAERVPFSLAPKTSIEDLTSWIDKDQPTRAELSCDQSQDLCMQAGDVLASFSVPFTYVQDKKVGGDIVLVYERMTVSDCENSYIDNRHNFRNLNHPAFGCSVSANILQSVSDHQQIIKPALSGLPDAQKAVRVVERYNEVPTK